MKCKYFQNSIKKKFKNLICVSLMDQDDSSFSILNPTIPHRLFMDLASQEGAGGCKGNPPCHLSKI